MQALACMQRRAAATGRAGGQAARLSGEMHAGEGNSTAAQLEGGAWQLLLSRIGDTLMLFLLMHTSIFLPLPHGCFLQAAGACVAQAWPLTSGFWHFVYPLCYLFLCGQSCLC